MYSYNGMIPGNPEELAYNLPVGQLYPSHSGQPAPQNMLTFATAGAVAAQSKTVSQSGPVDVSRAHYFFSPQLQQQHLAQQHLHLSQQQQHLTQQQQHLSQQHGLLTQQPIKYEYMYPYYANPMVMHSQGMHSSTNNAGLSANNTGLIRSTLVPAPKISVLKQAASSTESTSVRCAYLPWSEAEDKELCAVIKELREEGLATVLDIECLPKSEEFKRHAALRTRFWICVSSKVKKRSAKQCRERWNNTLDPKIIHHLWSIEEDLLLLKAQHEHGNKWSLIAQKLKGRTENGVKTRFKSILRAKNRMWSPQEDALLLQLYRTLGPRWSHIRKRLPKRSLHGVKMRYRALCSGYSDTSVTSGAPEQSFPYDFKTYFANKSLPVVPTVCSPSDDGSSSEDDEKEEVKKEEVKVFAAGKPSEDRLGEPLSPAQVPTNKRSSIDSVDSEGMARQSEASRTKKHCPSAGAKAKEGDDTLTSVIGSILINARSVTEVEKGEYQDFENYLADMVGDKSRA